MLKRRILGRTGYEVTEIGFGAWGIGGSGYGPVAEKAAYDCLETYIEQGGNFIDTASRYGESERIIGDFLHRTGLREDVVVASKAFRTEAHEIRAELEETLRLLQCDSVDLYYLHFPPDDPTEMHRVLDTYDELKQEGKIRTIGASIKGTDVTQKTPDLCRQYLRSGRVDVLQVIYSIFRQKNEEILQEAADRNVGIVARTVLESGFLTGKYAPGHEFVDHRRRWAAQRLGRILDHVQELKQSAVTPPYQTLSQIAIRFALDEPGISTVIIGAKSVQQAQENIKVASLPPLGRELRQSLIDKYGGLTEEFNTRE